MSSGNQAFLSEAQPCSAVGDEAEIETVGQSEVWFFGRRSRTFRIEILSLCRTHQFAYGIVH